MPYSSSFVAVYIQLTMIIIIVIRTGHCHGNVEHKFNLMEKVEKLNICCCEQQEKEDYPDI